MFGRAEMVDRSNRGSSGKKIAKKKTLAEIAEKTVAEKTVAQLRRHRGIHQPRT